MKRHSLFLTTSLAAALALAACGGGDQNQPVGQPTPGGGGDAPSSGVPGQNVVPTPQGLEGETNPPAPQPSAMPTT